MEQFLRIVKRFGKVNKAIIGIKDENLRISIEKQICGSEIIWKRANKIIRKIIIRRVKILLKELQKQNLWIRKKKMMSQL